MPETTVNPASGEITLTEFPIGYGPIGGLPSTSLGFSNLAAPSILSPFGPGWYCSSLPQLSAKDGVFEYCGLPRRAIYFEAEASGGFSAKYYAKSALQWDAGSDQYVFTGASGNEMLMFSPSHLTRPGFPKGYRLRSGITLLYDYDSQDRVSALTKTVEDSSNGIYFSYTGDNSRISDMTVVVANQPVRRTRYEYVAETGLNGMAGDLMFVISESFNPVTGDWEELGRIYYRYYTEATPADGFAHGLKFRISPEGCSRMRAAGLDPVTASDAEVAPYAHLHFKYQTGWPRRVREVVVHGKYTHTYSYSYNPNNDQDQEDFSTWDLKTVQTLPDGNTLTHYSSNRAILFQVFQKTGSATEKWCRYYIRDGLARVQLFADASAIASGPNEGPGPICTLKNGEGLVRLYFWTDTNRLEEMRVRQGGPISMDGTKYTFLEYSSVDELSPNVQFPKALTMFQSATGDGDPSTTSFTYQFHEGTYQMSKRTTTLPVIPTEQNGTGVAAQRIELFDANGNVTWIKDERGFLTAFSYDPITLKPLEMIEDVNTEIIPCPEGWVTPAGGGANLVTNYEYDLLGRGTQVLGPWRELASANSAEQIRPADWTVYRDTEHEQYAARGFVRGEELVPCLVNPVQITRLDHDQNVTDQIEAVRLSGGCGGTETCECGVLPVITAGRLAATDAFPQSLWSRWTSYQRNTASDLISERRYFNIPGYGAGQAGRHFAQTEYGYDGSGRRNLTRAPGGTYTQITFTPMGWLDTTSVGTILGTPGEGGNMVKVEEREYDGGEPGGAGELTLLKRFAGSTDVRETSYEYDYRHFRTAILTQAGYGDHFTHDNLGRTTVIERKTTDATPILLAKATTGIDNQGRVFDSSKFAVEGGVAGNAIRELTWYDPSGNVLKRRPQNGTGFQKFVYDGVRRVIIRYTACATVTDDLPGSVASDIVGEQVETDYDGAGNAIAERVRQRFHNALDTDLGGLGTPVAEPKARVYYRFMYPDPIGRPLATADFGTNGGLAPVRPATIPASSDTCLVSQTIHNARGEQAAMIDPNGIITTQTFDDAARLIKTVENAPVSSMLKTA